MLAALKGHRFAHVTDNPRVEERDELFHVAEQVGRRTRRRHRPHVPFRRAELGPQLRRAGAPCRPCGCLEKIAGSAGMVAGRALAGSLRQMPDDLEINKAY